MSTITTLKNPCLDCDHHLAGGDKNCERCRTCKKRIEYVASIDTCPCASVSEHVSLEGDGGFDLPGIPPDPVEKQLEEICEQHGTNLAAIRKGIQGWQNKAIRRAFHDTRDHIIEFLLSGSAGKFTQGQIGKLLNLAGATISGLIKDRGISKDPGKNKNTKPAPVKPKQETSARSSLKPKQEISDRLSLWLDFTNFPEIYDSLRDLASQEIRSIEGQALYMFMQMYKRGLKLQEHASQHE